MRILIALLAAATSLIPTAKAALERTLIDPGSAQYRDVRQTAVGGVCGEYNAKNRLGGYVGFTRFAWKKGLTVSGDIVTFGEEDKVEAKIEAAAYFRVAGCPELGGFYGERDMIDMVNKARARNGRPLLPTDAEK